MEQTLKTYKWNKKETKQFLKAYCDYPQDWETIASYVGTRTVSQSRSFAQKTFIRIQKEVQIRRNNKCIHDERYNKRLRPAPHSIYLASSNKKIIQKSLKRKAELRNLEETALKVHQDEKRNKEARRLGLEVKSEENLSLKEVQTAQRPYKRRLEISQVLRRVRRLKKQQRLPDVEEKESKQQEMPERLLSMDGENQEQLVLRRKIKK